MTTGRKRKVVLVVVAHGDDMEFLAGGTVARFVDEKGYDVYEYILTDNSKGSYRLGPAELAGASAREAEEAGRVLGLRAVRFEGYADGELNAEPVNAIRGKIMAVIREVKADIVMSWDPFAPYEGHPDHRVVAMASLEAASFSGNPRFHPEHAHPPHPVTEAYWFAKSPTNARCFVDISSTIDKKLEALLKHDTQMALTVDGILQEARALGVSVPGLEQAAEAGAHGALMDAGVRAFCARTGAQAGLPVAEQFRYERLGMLDTVLGAPAIEPDF
ncbi:MAG: PIG-L family deacetylase [Candidatus Hydrogenedentes bacterium]|nr:PIG-L family deacetylase [Candidatus Hydrogenedentota bacterium]